MIEDGFDRYFRRELGETARVIVVIVTNDDVVDLLHSRVTCRSHDAISIAVVVAIVAGIDQHRFTGGRNVEGCFAAFHIDSIDSQRGVLGLGWSGKSEENQRCGS